MWSIHRSSSSCSRARSEQALLAVNRQPRCKRSASNMELLSFHRHTPPAKRRIRARRIPIWGERSCFSPQEPRLRKLRCPSPSLTTPPSRLTNSSSSLRQVSGSGCQSTRCAKRPQFTRPTRRTALASRPPPSNHPPPANRKANKWSPESAGKSSSMTRPPCSRWAQAPQPVRLA